MELKAKTIIITGASSGIGAAAAKLFAQEGANLILGARRKLELDTLVAGICEAGGTATAIAGDVTDPLYASELADAAVSRFGGLDGAFNNAGTIGDLLSVPEMTVENWQHVITTNLTSAFLAAKYQIPALRDRGGGSIVFTSSFVGFSNGGMPGMGAYAASKAGLIGLAKSLASEHATQAIRVNTVLPGGTITPMAGNDPDTLNMIAALHPMKRLAQAEEISQAALFLLSDRSAFMTGSPVLVDGGMSVRLL